MLKNSPVFIGKTKQKQKCKNEGERLRLELRRWWGRRWAGIRDKEQGRKEVEH